MTETDKNCRKRYISFRKAGDKFGPEGEALITVAPCASCSPFQRDYCIRLAREERKEEREG